MKQIWTGRAAQFAGKYGEAAPAATVCCNACRTCLTSNLVALAAATASGIGLGAARITRQALGYSKR